MRLEFVNHASFVIEASGLRLIGDPWLDGAAFDDSWGLLAPSVFRSEDFAGITHIWFSHEHPDHFHPPTLKRIPAEVRRGITVLFQTTVDRKVVDFCTQLGFGTVRELPDREWVELAPGFQVLCGRVRGFQDSWLCVRTPGATLLNLNDCTIFGRPEARAIREIVGPVDVLATQFSISAWGGNAEDLEVRREGARGMLDRAVMQCEELRARHVLPIASFIWFCHTENAFMNEGFLPLSEVVNGLRTRTSSAPVIMYPGDTWTVGQPVDIGPALVRYERDQASIPGRARVPSRLVSPQELIAASHKYCIAMREGSDLMRLKLRWATTSVRRRGPRASKIGSLLTLGRRVFSPEAAMVYVTDHRQAYSFHPVRGLETVALEPADCDVSLTSAALNYAFKFLWGGETLLFNGRFHESRPGSRARLFAYFHMAGALNFGDTASWRTLPRDIARRARTALGGAPPAPGDVGRQV